MESQEAALSLDRSIEGGTEGETTDVVIVGAGPAGCVAALLQARRGRRVVLLEARPRASGRLAGEWLHPPALSILESIGLELRSEPSASIGRGFVVMPEDGSRPIGLPYADGRLDCSIDHRQQVGLQRDAVRIHPAIDTWPGCVSVYLLPMRPRFRQRAAGEAEDLRAAQVIGAGGRSSRVRRALGVGGDDVVVSSMLGLRLRNVEPVAHDSGHIFLGAPGPMLAYRIGPDEFRLCIDIPLSEARDAISIFERHAPHLPSSWRSPLRDALLRGDGQWALNRIRDRQLYGRGDVALIGDAVGYQHPLTAAGLTQAFSDALALADARSVDHYASMRGAQARTTEHLARLLHRVFTAHDAPGRAIVQHTQTAWRRDPAARDRSMRLLACDERRPEALALTFVRVAGPALLQTAAAAALRGDRRLASEATAALRDHAVDLLRWVGGGRRREGASDAPSDGRRQRAAEGRSERRRAAARRHGDIGPAAAEAVETATRDLLERQHGDGRFEGEVVWCPMLAAQYVMMCAILGTEIGEERRAQLILHFDQTAGDAGLWRLHPLSPPYLFVTTLVYIALRLLGEPASSDRLGRARAFIQREEVVSIPSWGKLWLCMLGLYEWEGAPPILPELWALPDRLFFHPAAFYCHTRQIYLAMSSLCARRPRAEETPRLREIRAELYPGGDASVDWRRARGRLRSEELVAPPGLALRTLYRVMALYERRPYARLRARALRELDERMRFEFESTNHTGLSPVSGMLSILALHAGAPKDPTAIRALEGLEAWFWQGDGQGCRIAGARSATWDTSFALQALSALPESLASSAEKIEGQMRAARFLLDQQVRAADPSRHAWAYRVDPDGGFCFASRWHGWPVSDCTAEAIEALQRAGGEHFDAARERRAIAFLLRCQNPDGGFGSYEARKSRIGLEWLNPAEMFGDSMTEHSYVECTASALCAMASHRARFGPEADPRITGAMRRAERVLRRLQRGDGSWRGVWGVHFVYGTWFGIRGLVAAGASTRDPALQRARAWLRSTQRPDGSWGEDPCATAADRYVAGEQARVVQTAWALLALLEARETDWDAVQAGARFLIERRQADGRWPEDAPSGLFFQTALLDYRLYRVYFPLWALARYEDRRARRVRFALDRQTPSASGSATALEAMP